MKYWARSKEVTIRMSFQDVLRMSAGRFNKILRKSSSQLLSISRDTFVEQGRKEYNVNVLCIMFKIDVLETSQGRRFRTELGRPWDIFLKFMRHCFCFLVVRWNYTLKFPHALRRSLKKIINIYKYVYLHIFISTYSQY